MKTFAGDLDKCALSHVWWRRCWSEALNCGMLSCCSAQCGADLQDEAAALREEAACVVLRAPLGSAESAGGLGASSPLSFFFF